MGCADRDPVSRVEAYRDGGGELGPGGDRLGDVAKRLDGLSAELRGLPRSSGSKKTTTTSRTPPGA
jgi:hypothetical protein